MKLVMASLVVLAVACGGAPPTEPSGEHCTPGEQAACTCPDGTQSIKQCSSNGTWGSCQCSGQ